MVRGYDLSDTAIVPTRSELRARTLSAKVRVLFLVSNPCKESGLALDEEARAVAEKIRSTDHRDVLDLITAWAVRPDDLQSLLMRHRPHVVHFSGHGTLGKSTTSGSKNEAMTTRDMIVAADYHRPELVLASEGGTARLIKTAILVDLFSVLKDNVVLLILNVCHSAQTAQELSEVVPFSIGMMAKSAIRRPSRSPAHSTKPSATAATSNPLSTSAGTL
jgi:hypothetical protein